MLDLLGYTSVALLRRLEVAEGAFGLSHRPLLGYLLLLEDSPQTRQQRAKPFRLPHFTALDEFQHTSYAERYDLFCRKAMQVGYTALPLCCSPAKKAASRPCMAK